MLMSKIIKRSDISKEKLEEFQSQIAIDKKLSELLIGRGIDTLEKVADFFNPDYNNTFDPFSFSGISDAVTRIKSAIDNKENIVIYGDYDCDGISSVAILYLSLKNAGASVWYYIPDRHNEGYGINLDAIEKIAENYFPDLIITVDCGITSVSEIKVIEEEMGIDVIVTDHHSLKDEIPSCIVINPKLDKTKNAPDLCGAGVSLKLTEALFGREEAKNYIDLAGIATIADMVELKGDNRIIASLAIKKINEGKANTALSMLAKKISTDGREITSSDIAFKIAPRLNATGRISTADKAVELFLTNDRNEIMHILNELERDNSERQIMCNDVYLSAVEMLKEENLSEQYAIVLYNPLWDGGVVGIAASKIAEEYMRPTILLTSSDGLLLKGSARSIKDLDLLDAIRSQENFLNSFGGHYAAAGVTLFKENLEEFKKSISDYIRDTYPKDTFEKTLVYDLMLDFKDIDLDFVNALERFEPFGIGNSRPIFISKAGNIPLMKMKSGEHYRVRIDGEKELVAFNFKKGAELMNLSDNVMLAYNLQKDIFQNKQYIKGIVKEAYLSETDYDEDYLCALSLEQLRYDDISYPRIKSVKDIKYKTFGTLFYAFSKETYIAALDELKFQNSYLSSTQSDFSTVHIGTLSNIDLDKYKNIVLLEKPLSGGFINAVKNKFNGNIYVIDKENPLKNILKQEAPNRDDVIEVFLRIKNCVKKLSFEGLKPLYNKIFKDKNLSFVKFSACIHILLELKVIIVYNNLEIEISKIKTDLNNSNVYRYLTNL